MPRKKGVFASLLCLLSMVACSQLQNETGKMLEMAGDALYPSDAKHANVSNDYDEGLAGDSYAAQQRIGRGESSDNGDSFGTRVENSAGRVLDNAGSVIRYTEKKLFVEDEENKVQDSSTIERSAGRVFDNAQSVVRYGAARMWKDTEDSNSRPARWQDYDERSAPKVSEENLLD